MKRGEIYFANLNPTVGKEIKKIRPILIVSNNANNKSSDTITIIPLTSKINKVYSFEVYLKPSETGLNKPSKAKCQQIRTISKSRITGKKIGIVSAQCSAKIDYGIKLHLDLLKKQND